MTSQWTKASIFRIQLQTIFQRLRGLRIIPKPVIDHPEVIVGAYGQRTTGMRPDKLLQTRFGADEILGRQVVVNPLKHAGIAWFSTAQKQKQKHRGPVYTQFSRSSSQHDMK